ncbi:MAG: N-acetylmuramoyl-L-alanine amidase [Candidatus Riflebacteria bacterium]|nr:N-acetylmuramoyl-L-alanine amidase [Candidatus Riflebacteria bacterium]
MKAALYHNSTLPARVLLALLLLWAAGWPAAAARAAPNQLRSIEPPVGAQASDLVLRFSERPEFVRVPLDSSLVLVLDFPDTVYAPIRRRFEFETGSVRSLGVTQFSKDRVRLSLKLASRGKVEIFRRRDADSWSLTMRILLASSAPPAPARTVSRRQVVIVLDPGHGGRDEGARGRVLREKDMALAIAFEARNILERDPRLQVRLTRSADVYVPLDERSAYADRAKAALFISIHANSALEGNPTGVEIYFLSLKGATDEQSRLLAEQENAAGNEASETSDKILDQIMVDMVQTSTLNQSSKLANILMRNWTRSIRQKGRGVRQAGFRVLRAVNIPSVLLECGFISNRLEERLLADPRYHRAVGNVLYQSVVQYLKSAGQL